MASRHYVRVMPILLCSVKPYHQDLCEGQCPVSAASSTGRCNTIHCIDSTMLARENHLFGCTWSKPSQSSVPAGLALVSDFGSCFQCQAGSSLVLRRPIEITALTRHADGTVKRARRNLRYSQRKTFAESTVQTRNTRASAATSPKCADHGSPCQIPPSRETAYVSGTIIAAACSRG